MPVTADLRLFRVNASAFFTKMGSTNIADSLCIGFVRLKVTKKPIIEIGLLRTEKVAFVCYLTFP